MTKQTPKPVNDGSRPKFGIPLLLAQSHVVVSAFGRPLGFILIMTALLISAGAMAGGLFLLGRALARFL
jgi:hypothetical protein